MTGQWNSTKIRSLDMVMHFGKHKGKTIREIMDKDMAWIKWALAQKKPVIVFTKEAKEQIEREKQAKND